MAVTADGSSSSDEGLEELAAAWLRAEQALTAGIRVDATEDAARVLSDRYDAAIRAASQEDLRLAWEAARKIQGDQVMGSAEWLDARQVSQLLRTEYLARDPDGA